MTEKPDVDAVAGALLVSVGMLIRRVRQVPSDGDLTMPESSALARLDRGGPTTSSALAKQEQISPQSMGATLGGLETRGLVERSPDPDDGRRIVLSLTDEGRHRLRNRRSAKADHVARALAAGFTEAELARLRDVAPLLERLAQSV